jgi:hypothetical protein
VKHKREPLATLDGVGDEYVLNMADLAMILDVDRSTASDLCARGTILGAFQVGRLWRIQARELRKHIDRERLPKNREIYELRETPRAPRRRRRGFS